MLPPLAGLPPGPSRNADRVSSSGGQDEQPGTQVVRPDTTDDSTISDQARQLQSLANVAVVNAKRVEGVQEALANGTYRIRNEQVANKLIDFEIQLEKLLGTS